MLKSDAREGNENFIPQSAAKLGVPQRQKALQEQPLKIPELNPELSFSFTKPSLPVKTILEPDSAWRNKLVHPSIVLILGKRGSGKSTLAYRLLELFRYGLKSYVVGVPVTARSILPDWLGMVASLEDLPNKAIAIISRSLSNCKASGTSIGCRVPDGQMDRIINAIELHSQWLEEVLAIINLKDKTARIMQRRSEVQDKLKRMGKIYVDKLISDDEYNRQLRMLNGELESLVVPNINAAEEAGRLISHLPELWAGANLEEKRQLLSTMLDAVDRVFR